MYTFTVKLPYQLAKVPRIQENTEILLYVANAILLHLTVGII